MTEITNAEKAAQLPKEIGEVIGERNGTHGDPVDNHDHIADLWSAYLGVGQEGDSTAHNLLARPLEGHEVADLMILLKLSRKHVGGMDLDHYRDTIGYAAIAALYVPGYMDDGDESLDALRNYRQEGAVYENQNAEEIVD
ncbi:DUF6378 domain-containing protein [Halorubellus litoreus]|uniref:DUF6378 domain-containing protein n=1 Tax=Halorubellus litoreus TaxID=755308 RepID=A0ABD5VHR6_9EURY